MHSSRSSRRRAVAAAAVAAISALALAACAPSSSLGGSDRSGGSSVDTFKVGILAPMTGFVSAIGKDLQQGWDLYWKQNGTEVGDFTVDTVLEDDASSADTALTKAARLVKEEKVDVVVGPVLANQALAVGDYLDQQGVANLAQSSADDVTQRKASPMVLRTGAMAGSQTTFPGGKWAYDEGYRTAATLCVDYAFGWESCGGFVSAFTSAGGKVTKQLWYPGDATDLSTYVTQLASQKVDMVFVGTAGGTDSSNFLRSASDFGLLKTPILTNCCTLDQAILQDVGDIALDIKSVSYYAEGGDRQSAFVKAFEKEYGVIPSVYAMRAYATAQLLAAALAEADAKPTGKDLVSAIKDADLSDTIWGKVSFDDHNNIVGPVMVREVAKRSDGKLWNTVVTEYDDVSQFWTYDPEKFLADPPFSTTRTGK
jgi:branched-chain amino acid transport system substrate-binding protein